MRWVIAARSAAVTQGSVVLMLLGCALLTAMLVASAAPASACSFPAPPTAEVGSAERDAVDAEAADAVVVGTVVAYYNPPDDEDSPGTAYAVYTVSVDAVLKGTATRLERVLDSSPFTSGCGGGSALVLHQRMVVFLRAVSPPTLGARYIEVGGASHPVTSAADVSFPGAVSAPPLPGGSIATAGNTPGVRPWTQTQAPTAALVAVGVAVGGVVLATLLRRGRDSRRTSRP